MKNNADKISKYLIIDQNTLSRETLSTLIYDANKFNCFVYQSEDIKHARSIASSYMGIEKVIVGPCASGSEQIDSIKTIKTLFLKPNLMVIPNSRENTYLNHLESLGVCVLVTSNSTRNELETGIRALSLNNSFICRNIRESRISNNTEVDLNPHMMQRITKNKKLTKRQVEVLQHIVSGHANKRIAYDLGVTEGTIKLHVSTILKMLNVSNRTKAALIANEYLSAY